MFFNLFTASAKVQRYFWTLVVWNHLASLFLSLALYASIGVALPSLFIMIAVISHTAALMCLITVDFFEWAQGKLTSENIPFYRLATLATALAVVPGVYVGFLISKPVAIWLNIAWHPPLIQVLAPGLFFAAIVLIFNLFHATLVDRLRLQLKREHEIAVYKNNLLKAQLELLSKELNPHLLFNLIQGVLAVLHKDPNRAQRMLEKLAVYYQSILPVIHKEAISLAEELTLMKIYVDLNHERIANLAMTIDIDERCKPFLIPPLFLQPFVENSIKHGLTPLAKDLPKSIILRAYAEDHFVVITILDNGTTIIPKHFMSQRARSGLNMCRMRMREFYGPKALLDLSHSQQGTLVTLRLPHE